MPTTRNLTESKKQVLRDVFVRVLEGAGVMNFDFDLADFLDRGREPSDIWVDSSRGNDDFEGFQARPFRTIGRALKEVGPEQYSPLTIHVKRGTYTDVLKVASMSTFPITIQGEDFDVFSPASGVWSAAGTLNTPRYYHKAVLLQDGRVLVAGGVASGGPTATVETYNSGTNTWTTVNPMVSDRYAHELVLLQDGRVLAVGGVGGVLAALDTAEIYNPGTNSWANTGSLTTARQGAAAVLLNDGRVLVAGGLDSGGAPLASVEIFDPGTGLWSAATSMATARHSTGITLLQDGKVLVAGGTDSTLVAEIYNPTSNTWSNTGNMVGIRYFGAAHRLSDGRVLIAGGTSDTSNLNTAEIYNQTTNTWSAISNMSTEHGNTVSVQLSGGKILVAGGANALGSAISISETFNSDPALSGEPWRPTGDLSQVRQNATLTLLTDGTAIIAGGLGASTHVAVAERYNPNSATSSGTIASFTAPTATVTSAGWPTNNLRGKMLRIKSGTFNGNMYPIYGNNAITMDIGCADAIGGATFDIVTPAVILKKNTIDDSTTLAQALVHSSIVSAGAQQTVNVTPAPYGLIIKNIWLSSDSTNLTKYFVQNAGIVSFQNCIITQADTGSIGGGTWVTNSDGTGTTIHYTGCYINTPRLHRAQLNSSCNIYIKDCVWLHTTNNNCLEFDGCGEIGVYITGSFVVDCGTGIFLNVKGTSTNVRQGGGVYIKSCGTGIGAFGKMTWNGTGDFIITTATTHGIEIRQNAFWSGAGTSLQFGTGAFRILSAGQDGIRMGASHCFVGLQYANPVVIQNCGGWGIQMGYKGNSTQGNVSRFNLVQMASNANTTMSSNTSGDMTVDGTTATSQANLNAAGDKTVTNSTLQNVVLMTA